MTTVESPRALAKTFVESLGWEYGEINTGFEFSQVVEHVIALGPDSIRCATGRKPNSLDISFRTYLLQNGEGPNNIAYVTSALEEPEIPGMYWRPIQYLVAIEKKKNGHLEAEIITTLKARELAKIMQEIGLSMGNRDAITPKNLLDLVDQFKDAELNVA